jgi:hypothetical protein
MACGRHTRLTNAHSKSLRHRTAMQPLFVAWYNFGRKNESLKSQTRAMASKLTDRVWTINELLERAADAERQIPNQSDIGFLLRAAGGDGACLRGGAGRSSLRGGWQSHFRRRGSRTAIHRWFYRLSSSCRGFYSRSPTRGPSRRDCGNLAGTRINLPSTDQCPSSGHTASGFWVTSTRSIRWPSMSTTSSVSPFHSALSPIEGMWPS